MGWLSNSLKGLTGGIKESFGGSGHDKIGNTVGQWMNNLTGATDMYNKEYAGNVALWNMQNEYNTPAAQIARMKAAGIDVNPLTYAVGNGNMSTAAGNISAPSVGAGGIGPVGALMSVLSGIQGIKNMKETAGLTRENKFKTANERDNLTTMGSILVNNKFISDVDRKTAELRYKMLKVAYPAFERQVSHQAGDWFNYWRNIREATSAILPLSGAASNIADIIGSGK